MAENQYAQWNQKIIDEFRANSGTVNSAPFGRSLVLVHHTGAKSGTERITPVMYIRQDPDTWLIAASKAGTPENPAWYHNLLAHPDTTIETPDDGVVAVHVVDLKGEERDAAWDRFTTISPGFRAYQERTTRIIPVLALGRRTS
ncbi:deazaflavin-dependent oxidoreductase (nitroreductase family) [Promicromonospora sp. AC04]|uniref:nitroreductase family deazaflavin-dependent oxidoreductase n=1 Tax=Promicromonospora sp. AC04 TaxID=2135723 RepID=UPI000D38188A|nr:nitroreductase family deazaflavin-dependent oxidoreductase [Promicromonospora sp. AC04]PUB27677.1 deazaflavin-dependent oxidoreductase (nitroreductase family) [Promicromonospora sp. AC04]